VVFGSGDELAVHRVLERSEDLGRVEARSDQLISEVERFQRSSEELRHRIYWRNLKIKVILGVVVSVSALYIAIPLAIRFS